MTYKKPYWEQPSWIDRRRREAYNHSLMVHRSDIAALFKAVRRETGARARMSFSCCRSCGSYELSQMAKPEQPIMFYCRQSNDSYDSEGYLWKNRAGIHLSYFINTENYNADEQTAFGHAIKREAERLGLVVKWNGNPNQTICITPKKENDENFLIISS